MAGDRAEITKGDKAPDALRFRVGSCTVRVNVTSKNGSATFFATDFMASYNLEGLPMCVLQIPVGTPVGPLAAAGKPDDHSFANLRKYIKNYSQIEVVIEVATLTSTADVGNAMKPGKYTAFSGLVSSTRFNWTGRSSLTLQVNVIHELIKLSSGSPLYSRLVSANGFADMATKISNFTANADVPVSPEPWDMFIRLAAQFLVTDDVDQKDWVSRDDNAKKVLKAVGRSVDLLQRIKSWTTLAYEGAGADTPERAIRDLLASVITSTAVSMNLLSECLSCAEALRCNITFGLKDGYYIPLDPLWKRSDMKFIRGGMAFDLTSIRRSGSSYISTGYDITGTVLRVLSSPDFTVSTTMRYGSWLMPDAYVDSDFALYSEVIFPKWLDAYAVVLTDVKQEGNTAPLTAVKPSSVAAPPATPSTVPDPDVTNFKRICERYAYYNTLIENLGTNSVSLSVGLRDDIVPGICIGVITRSPTGEEYTLYGHVVAVSTEISVSNLSARTTIELKTVRGDEIQDLIDNEGLPNFAWIKIADKLNALTLWSPAS